MRQQRAGYIVQIGLVTHQHFQLLWVDISQQHKDLVCILAILPTKRIKLIAIGWRGPSAIGSDYVCLVGSGGGASYSKYSSTRYGVRPVVSIPASGAPAALKTALGINN